jgi:hypothetical protein
MAAEEVAVAAFWSEVLHLIVKLSAASCAFNQR